MPEYGQTFQFNLFCNKCMIYLQHVESMDTLLSVVKAYQIILDKSSVVAETSSKTSGVNVGSHHKQWFQHAIYLGYVTGVTSLASRRRCGRQLHRNNVEGDTPEEYYRRVITMPYPDVIGLLQHMNTSFKAGIYKEFCGIAFAMPQGRSENMERRLPKVM